MIYDVKHAPIQSLIGMTHIVGKKGWRHMANNLPITYMYGESNVELSKDEDAMDEDGEEEDENIVEEERYIWSPSLT